MPFFNIPNFGLTIPIMPIDLGSSFTINSPLVVL